MDGYRTKDYYYELPEELIAQEGTKNRDESRLLVVHRDNGNIEHESFRDVLKYLNAGDGLVLNNSRVIPARLYGNRLNKDEKIEVLLVKPLNGAWQIMGRPGKKLRINTEIIFSNELSGRVVNVNADGTRIMKFNYSGNFLNILEKIGEMPTPPYIHKKLTDRERYQTVYSKEYGSVAAPTAGLHFTNEILEEIKNKRIEIINVTLHVGMGTFLPVKTEEITNHHMHSEWYEIGDDEATKINEIKKSGNKIFAVGTTSTRALESSVKEGKVKSGIRSTDIFIYPGYEFKVVDSLITNFHLPESTLLMLVSAFYDRKKMLEVYEEAIKERYRFFSFGDAMLIL